MNTILLTPPNLYPFGLHDTAATFSSLYFKFKFKRVFYNKEIIMCPFRMLITVIINICHFYLIVMNE